MKTQSCPKCGTSSKAVKPVTPRSLLKDSEKSRLADRPYFFCAASGCPVVYFDDSGKSIFGKDALSVRVGIKETGSLRPVCYFFNHTIEEIEEEIRQTGETTVLDDIKTRMKEACWCETTSPMGSCCLATVTKEVKAAKSRLGGFGDCKGKETSDGGVDCCSPEFSPEEGPLDPVEADCCANHSDSPAKPEPKSRWGRKAGIVAMIGSLFSAVVVSACCWLPLLLIAAGVSGAAVGSAIEAYRPLFLGAAFVFLAAAFYFAYRPKTTTPGSETPDSECCSTGEGSGWNLQKTNRLMLWLITFAVVAFTFFPNYIGSILGDRGAANFDPDQGQIVIAVEGMTCEACAATLTMGLEGKEGVSSTRADYEKGQAIVSFLLGDSVATDELLEVVSDAGYHGRILNGKETEASDSGTESATRNE